MRKRSFSEKATLTFLVIVIVLIPIVLDDLVGIGSPGSGYGTYPTDSGGELTVKSDTGLTGSPGSHDSKTKGVGDTSGISYPAVLNYKATYAGNYSNPNWGPLSFDTAWLYLEVQSGILDGNNSTGTEDDKSEALAILPQDAVWSLEGEGNEPGSGNPFKNIILSQFQGNGGIHQDTPGSDPATAPVPEPATMLLVGSGLIALAGLARKRFKKQF